MYILAKRAKLYFKPIDYEYQKEYGIMPDYDHTNRLRAGGDPETVSKLIEERMAKVWAKMKAEHEREVNGVWEAVSGECPF